MKKIILAFITLALTYHAFISTARAETHFRKMVPAAFAPLPCNKLTLMWDGDKINELYQCSSRDANMVEVCVARATWGYNQKAYIKVSGSYLNTNGSNILYGTVFEQNDPEGDFREDQQSFFFEYRPTSPIIISDKKYRSNVSLNKRTLQASYKLESKKKMSLSSWDVLLNADLSCVKLK